MKKELELESKKNLNVLLAIIAPLEAQTHTNSHAQPERTVRKQIMRLQETALLVLQATIAYKDQQNLSTNAQSAITVLQGQKLLIKLLVQQERTITSPS